MDALRSPWQSACLLIEINRSPDGRLEGQLRSQTADAWRLFSGVLELLKAIEEALDAIDRAAHAQITEGTES